MLIDKDFYTDPDILLDPYAYFEEMRRHGPIFQPPGRDYLIVTGFEEALEIFKNTTDFSASIALQGAGCPLSFKPEGSDISAQLEAHRSEILGHDLLVNLDDKPHANLRALVNKLFVPSRLKANEEFIERYSQELVENAVAKGGCELISEIATPFVTLVIADLLGVPADDRQHFMTTLAASAPPGALDGSNQHRTPLDFMQSYFRGYVADRRKNPRDDVITELATATFPDGSTPEAEEIVSLATFLFGAGQDTSAKLLSNTVKQLVEQPELQARVRADPTLIPALLEEMLRIEGSTKATFRFAKRDTQIGDVKVPVGTRIMVALAAGNRDPRRWDDPHAVILDRPRIKEHIGFGRGAHVCVGAPLARAELRILLEHLLKATADIDLLEDVHGPRGARRLDYEPSFIIRGLENLHLVLKPAADFAPADRPATVVGAA